ncbi:MAG: hypothetical protein ABSC08_05115 [Bryobacteraceae bacterium]
MSFSLENQQWVQEQIRAALDKALRGLKPPSGFKKALYLLREYGVLAGTAMVIVALLTFAAAGWNAANSRLEKEVEFRTKTMDTLARIDERLQRMQDDIRILQAPQYPARVLKEIAPLPPKEFVRNLPALRKAAEQPTSRVVADVPVLRRIASNLLAVPENTPDYWPTVCQFLRFATNGAASRVPPPGRPQVIIARNFGGPLRLSFSDKVVLLDGGDLLGDVSFVRCRIILTGNPVRMRGVKFIDCAFDLHVDNSPSQFTREASAQLLASNLTSVTMTTPRQ